MKIRVMIVDDTKDTRTNLKRLLELEADIEVVGEAGDGQEGIQLAHQLNPDIILMDINMPVLDGIHATEQMTVQLPSIGIIMLSVQGEQEYLRKAMAAGARDYLTKPPSSEDLLQTIHRVFEMEKKRQTTLVQNVAQVGNEEPREPGAIISIFSTKGGVGKSTIVANLGVALAQGAKQRVAIVDLDLQFGDIAMMFDQVPRRTIADLAGETEEITPKLLDNYLLTHSSGVKILAAPLRPEFADAVESKHLQIVLELLKQSYDYVLVDTYRSFDEITLTSLDLSDEVLLVTTLDVLTIKNVKLGLEAMAGLDYDPRKIKLVINRSNTEIGVSQHDLENSLSYKSSLTLPSDGKVVVASTNKGIPFVIADPKASITGIMLNFARELAGLPLEKKEKAGPLSNPLGWFKGGK